MCKHLNCVIQEEFLVHDVIFVDKGVVSPADQDLEYPISTGRFFLRCSDCGLERGYGSRKPKWLQRILGEALECLGSRI